MTDFIVIGGGLSGMLVARELAAAGAHVTLLEKGELGREASWAGSGILSPLYPWRYPDAVTALSRWSQDRFPDFAAELAEETGIDPEWLPSGFLIAEGTETAEALSWARRHGVAVESLPAEGLIELEPGLVTAGDGLWLPEVAQIRNPRLVKAMVRSLALRGVSVRTQTEVVAFAEQCDRVTGVRTRDELLPAEGVVMTAGAWTAELLGPLAADWHIAPVRGQMLLFHAAPDQVRRIVMRGDHYLVPRRDGRVLAGSTLEYVGFDKSTTAEAHETLYKAAAALIPALAHCPVERHWAGLRPGSAEGIPLICEYPERHGLYINTGHFRNGIVTGPASARLLVDLMLGRPPCVDPSPYRPPARQDRLGLNASL
jgi:glycine oxidase